jgi:hypothetical protein
LKRWSAEWATRQALRVPRWLAVRNNMLGTVPIIVYQVGKVGSTAVVAALERCWLPVVHVHRMDANHVRALRERRRSLGWRVPPVLGFDRLGPQVRRELIDRGGKAKFVTLVRDPLARNFSSYFNNLDFIWGRTNAHEGVSPEALVAAFMARFPHDEVLNWFDDEMLPVTGIDVYDHPFPACGHCTITTDRLELLLLKTELPDETKSAALARFVGREALTVKPLNLTSEKPSGAAFQAFRAALSLEPAFVDRFLESRYTTHFYTRAERDGLRAKYLKIGA